MKLFWLIFALWMQPLVSRETRNPKKSICHDPYMLESMENEYTFLKTHRWGRGFEEWAVRNTVFHNHFCIRDFLYE